ncbi:uncharacterized protein [Dysidea avara]|uniref:uncharacterized protein n=1 Tax=Dysidea avara TaxID=196820 RepID=UPI003332698D
MSADRSNWNLGSSAESDPSDTSSSTSEAAAVLKKLSKCTLNGNPSVFQLPLKIMHTSEKLLRNDNNDSEDDNDDNDDDCVYKDDNAEAEGYNIVLARYLVGQSPTLQRSGTEKVLIIVGATGAGKTTLINSMVNYLLGLNYDDDFRFKLVSEKKYDRSQVHSQTNSITSYTIYTMNGFKLPHTLTIVDTPGYGDTQGLTRDRLITEQIQIFFSNSDKYGVDHLDGIGFVAQSASARLTPSQRYVFDSILALFGNNVKENIFIMVTFADGQHPPALNAISKAEIPYNAFYKFNNSAVFSKYEYESGKNFNRLFWEMGTSSFEQFFSSFLKSKPVSLSLIQQVLDERKKLDSTVYEIQKQIEKRIEKIENIRKEMNALQEHQAKIDANKAFTYKINVTKMRKDALPSGKYATNCAICHTTCHYPCGIHDDKQKFQCSAMQGSGENAKCRICLNQCSWNNHFSNSYKFEFYDVTETRTSDEL